MAIVGQPSFSDCPLEVVSEVLAPIPILKLAQFREVAKRCDILAESEVNRRVNSLIGTFFPGDQAASFWPVFNETASCVWGPSAMAIARPDIVYDASTLHIACPLTAVITWGKELIGWDWDCLSVRRGDSIMDHKSITDFVNSTNKSRVLKLAGTGGDNATLDHGLLTLVNEDGSLWIKLHVSAFDCVLPVVFSTPWTTELMFFDRSHFYIFHPKLLEQKIAMWRRGTFMEDTPEVSDNAENDFSATASHRDISKRCGVDCKATEFHFNRFTPSSLVWKYNWNKVSAAITPPYEARGWVWSNGSKCLNREMGCKWATPEITTEHIAFFL